MSIEAMKQGVEALEVMKAGHCAEEKIYINNAITALRQAIAQAEKQAPVAYFDSSILQIPADYFGKDGWVAKVYSVPQGVYTSPLYTAPLQAEKQEPVAWVTFVESFGGYPKLKASETQKEGYAPVFTAPSKREWVGLTEDEVKHYNNRLSGSNVAQEIESKLRERNK